MLLLLGWTDVVMNRIWNPEAQPFEIRTKMSGFWIVGTIATAKAWPFEIRPSKSHAFKWFWISNGRISDPHCNRYLNYCRKSGPILPQNFTAHLYYSNSTFCTHVKTWTLFSRSRQSWNGCCCWSSQKPATSWPEIRFSVGDVIQFSFRWTVKLNRRGNSGTGPVNFLLTFYRSTYSQTLRGLF